jgi:hypothetical protein
MYFVDHCRVCEQGLLGIRICCGGVEPLVVCDECEAVWFTPDSQARPLYPEQPHSKCPRCGQPLWSRPAHWATWDEIAELDWQRHVIGAFPRRDPPAAES